MACLAEHANRLHPAEDLFNALSFALADLISGVTSGASVDGAAAGPFFVLRHMRRYLQFPHYGYQVFGAVCLVGGDGHPFCSFDASAISIAASRSAVPLGCSSSVSTTNPLRFSIRTLPQ